MLNGGSAFGANGSHHLRVSSSSTAAAAGEACHLMECLRDFATEELVHDVECLNCTVLECLEKNEKEIAQAEYEIQELQRCVCRFKGEDPPIDDD